MSLVALALDLLLVTLLVCALYLGLRLNARLKLLREGQAGFIRAVAELDAAAARAESGLKSLRAASEATHDELLTRIETARGLIARLDGANNKAARLADEAGAPVKLAPSMPVAPIRAALARPEPAPAAPRFRPMPLRAAPAARGLDDDLFEVEPAEALLPRRIGQGQ